jgi:transcriptional regulator with XRE-family HTH domain
VPSDTSRKLSVVKTIERAEARRLRRNDGLPIKEIARRLGVSRSSVSLWVRDIELTEAQRRKLLSMNPAYNRQLLGQTVWAEECRRRRRAAQEDGCSAAQRGDPLHVAGCMLYWAEGAKHRNSVRLSNSDPEVVKVFVRFLRTFFDVRDEDIRVTCNLFADHADRQFEIEQFWLDTLELTRVSLCKSTVNVYSRHTQRKRLNKLPYGTCRVVVSRTAIVQRIYGSIQEYAGFTRDEWLD